MRLQMKRPCIRHCLREGRERERKRGVGVGVGVGEGGEWERGRAHFCLAYIVLQQCQRHVEATCTSIADLFSLALLQETVYQVDKQFLVGRVELKHIAEVLHQNEVTPGH